MVSSTPLFSRAPSRWVALAATAFAFLVACGDNYESTSTPDAALPECADGLDNDGDGAIDYPDDPGCTDANDTSENSVVLPSCSDGRDNDGDGKIDYPDDPACVVPQADTEEDDCPSGLGCPQCSDGVDNDGNGQIDYPGDPGCTSAADPLEFFDDANACGAGLAIEPLPATGAVTGTLTAASTSSLAHGCGGGNGEPAMAYIIHLTEPKVLVASTNHLGTEIDTVLDLRSAACSDPMAAIACHDDISSSNKRSELTRAVNAGTYYLVVQGATPGNFQLTVNLLAGAGSACGGPGDCGPGLVCRIPVGETSLQCSPPVCADSIDDDADGKADYPADPGCASPEDDSEDDPCAADPSDPGCPVCANGVDDDGDGLTDYPNDPSCVAASTTSESCVQSEEPIIATMPQTVGTTAGAVDDYRPPPGSFNGHTCSTTGTHTAPDVAVEIDLPATTTVSFKLSPVGYDSAHVLLNASCTGTPIECYDSPTSMVQTNLAGGRYYLVVDGYSSGSGTFTLNIAGTIADGESCELPLAQSGALVCGAGHSCKGPVGARTCQPAQCNDGVDNNGDGRMDYPADPSCTTPSDDSEENVCPGALCPACADGIDNDGDGAIDYPDDSGCVSASANNEGCASSEPVLAITTPLTTGTLVGATDDHNPSCVATNYADVVYTLDVPVALQSLSIDTEDSVVDTVLSLMNVSCGEPSIACDDDGGVGTGDSLILRGFTPPGGYTIAVDSDSSTLGTFNLNVRGTIIPGGSCESAMYASGVLVCPDGYGCNGAAGARKCTPAQCHDGIDNNSDGKVDYPNDPGCTSASDNSEDDVCPGASCPQCANGTDDDADGLIDYPADTGCTSASDDSEGCLDTDPILAITTPTTTGTLVGTTDDHQPFCTTNHGADQMYTLSVPALQSLTIDTEGSVVDTVLSFMNSSCEEPALACDDDGGVGTGDSLIARTFVPPGTYTIAVDADSTTPNTYELHVAGVLPPGASCEHPLVDSGVLACPEGYACDGAAGARMCVVAQCIDGVDNNGDGRTDYPDDPGCDSLSDNSEDTVCPGAACPVCADGVDNDGDTLIDYPNDPSCLAASWSNEACDQSEPVGVITQPVTTGNTTGAFNDYVPTCASSSSHAAPDLAYQLDLPDMATLVLNVTGFDTAHSLLDSTCGGTPIACSDPATMTRTNVPGGTYYVVVDGWSTGEGAWTLNTSGTIAMGGSCEVPLFTSGAFTCAGGLACVGTPGSRVCAPGQCNDGLDNNGDGKIDYPYDPGCSSPTDPDEDTVCPGASCPVCSNAADDDGDSLVDYPADFGCAAAGAASEVFCPVETDAATLITMPQTAGDLTSAHDDYEQSCQSNTGNDLAFALQLPVPVASLVVDTIGSTVSDTVLSVKDAACGAQLGCDDDGDPASNRSKLTLTNVAPGNYSVQVDGYNTTNNGPIVVNVKGTVAAGTDCTSALFTSGVLECATGTTCTAGTCQ